jgi:gas vesicle protein
MGRFNDLTKQGGTMPRVTWLCIISLIAFVMISCRSNVIHLNVTYTHLSGLAQEDRVIVGGKKAGTVAEVTYLKDGTYVVGLEIEKGFAETLTDASSFYVVDDPARQGHKAIEIRMLQQGGALLADGATVTGASEADRLEHFVRKTLMDGVDHLARQIDKLKQDIERIPDSEAYRQLERTLKELASGLKRSEKEARERIKREWLPKLEQELEKFRKRLRGTGREDELEPLEEEVERIRRI